MYHPIVVIADDGESLVSCKQIGSKRILFAFLFIVDVLGAAERAPLGIVPYIKATAPFFSFLIVGIQVKLVVRSMTSSAYYSTNFFCRSIGHGSSLRRGCVLNQSNNCAPPNGLVESGWWIQLVLFWGNVPNDFGGG